MGTPKQGRTHGKDESIKRYEEYKSENKNRKYDIRIIVLSKLPF